MGNKTVTDKAHAKTDMHDLPQDTTHLINSARGVYIPQDFAKSIRRKILNGVTDEQLRTLEAGPEQDQYWQVWIAVLDSAILTYSDGRKWRLWQDGDLWAVPMDWQPAD